MRRGRPLPTLAAVALSGLLALGCDDQIKYIAIFSTMAEQVSLEPGEEVPRTSVPGTMPIDGERRYGLLVWLPLPQSKSVGRLSQSGNRMALRRRWNSRARVGMYFGLVKPDIQP